MSASVYLDARASKSRDSQRGLKLPSADTHGIRSRASQGYMSQIQSSQWTERSTVARSHSSSPSRNSSAKSLYINPFGFDAKTSYDASKTLVQCRSDNFKLPETITDDDIWRRPPPDFRPQCYAPNPPKRNTREAMQPWKYGTYPGSKSAPNQSKQKRVVLPSLLFPHADESGRFVTRFDILDPDGARMEFAKEGMHKAGSYEDPKHHDYRGYPPLKSLGLVEFETNYEKDPNNVNFKTKRLDVMYGLPKGVATDRDTSGRQMAPPLPAQPSWESRLILPKSPFPKLSGEYTRYPRVGRSPHSALMERIETKLTNDWIKEKQTLQQKA